MMQLIIQRIAGGLGLPTETVAQLAQGGSMDGSGAGANPQALTASGDSAGGQNLAMAA